ncbi:MAG: Ig-like domain-containing protein, partial [Gemmatimonadales bacterium]
VVPQAPSAALWIGDTTTLTAEAKDPSGAVLGGRVVIWASSDPRIARVDAAGRLTAVAPGRATLTATSDGKRGTTTVTVTSIPVGAVTLDAATLTVTSGQTHAVKAKVTDPRGRTLERAVTWSSSAATVASVGSSGLIKAEGAGTARVSAEVDGKRAEVVVTVPSGLKEMPVATAPRPGAAATPTPGAEGAAPPASVPTPTPVPTATTPIAPAATAANAFAPGEVQLGGGQSCALLGGELWCWGAGRSGAPSRVGAMRFAEVSVGAAHSCGISDGKAYCWGANAKGQLGNNSTIVSGTPTEVGGGNAWRSIAAGGTHSCGVTAGGKVLCWGENKSGQLGDGTTTDRRTPTAISGTGSTAFIQVAAGKGHTCALTTGGKAWCWGDGFAGQLGTGLTQISSEPTEVAGRATFVRLDLGDSHSCGVTAAGQGWCWGEGRFGQLGEGATNDRSAPVQVRVSEPLADITAGGTHSCGVTRGGQVFCWGGNASGQLGDGSRVNRTRPVLIPLSGTFTSVGAGSAHSCATGAGGAFCWGDGRQGQLGDGGAAARPEPGPVTRG